MDGLVNVQFTPVKEGPCINYMESQGLKNGSVPEFLSDRNSIVLTSCCSNTWHASYASKCAEMNLDVFYFVNALSLSLFTSKNKVIKLDSQLQLNLL